MIKFLKWLFLWDNEYSRDLKALLKLLDKMEAEWKERENE